jgi:AAA+ superfamily predicted ATPase
VNPELYKLSDLMNDPVPGHFYRQQLVKSPAPNNDSEFFVEKILKKKTVKRKVFYLVKYLYYPDKFNQWIPKENFKK